MYGDLKKMSQKILFNTYARIQVLKETLQSNRIAYNTKVFQVDTKKTINLKSIRILEKGLGLKFFSIEPIPILNTNGMRLTFTINEERA